MAHRTICALQQQQAREALTGGGIRSFPAMLDSAGNAAAGAAASACTKVGASAGEVRAAAPFKPPPSTQPETEELPYDHFADPLVEVAGMSGVSSEAFLSTTRGRAASAAN